MDEKQDVPLALLVLTAFHCFIGIVVTPISIIFALEGNYCPFWIVLGSTNAGIGAVLILFLYKNQE